MLRSFITSLALFVASLTTPCAAAQGVTADPEAIAAILRENDISATIDIDGGNPVIDAAFENDGTKFAVYFYECEDGKACRSIQFAIIFLNTKAGEAEMVTWNRKYRYARGYIADTGDPAIELDLYLGDGVSRAWFDEAIDLWDALLVAFSELVYSKE